MYAARQGHLEVVELLLTNGADVNRKRNDGLTALTVAKNQGHLEVAELLLTYRAI